LMAEGIFRWACAFIAEGSPFEACINPLGLTGNQRSLRPGRMLENWTEELQI